jgi:hypothetical protein
MATGSRLNPAFTGGRQQCPHQATDRLAMAEHKHFAVCIRNEGYEASLELRKIYEVLDDADASAHQMVRVIDEEGEDYLYPAAWFVSIELPQDVEQAILDLVAR